MRPQASCLKQDNLLQLSTTILCPTVQEGFLVKYKDETVIGLITILKDITEKKRLQNAYDVARTQHESILNSAPSSGEVKKDM